MLIKKKDLQRLHIILDSFKANRCIWCGSQQSDDWIHGTEGAYCSDSCAKAKISQMHCPMAFMTILILALVLMIWLIDSSAYSDLKVQIVVFGVALAIISAIISISLYKDHKYALEIPKGSRSNIGVSEVSLLQKISVPVECPNCDANIDLMNVGEDMIYTCQYCGANGVIEIDIME